MNYIKQLKCLIQRVNTIFSNTPELDFDENTNILTSVYANGQSATTEISFDEIERTSELINDGENGTDTFVEFGDLAQVATTGNYQDLNNTPDIPNQTSDLQNDGEDGVNPFITLQDLPDVPEYTLSNVNGSNQFDLLKDNVVIDTIDLTPYLDDTNLARIVSGIVAPTTGIATITRDDNTIFTIDFSSLIDTQPTSTQQLLNEGVDGNSTYVENDEITEAAKIGLSVRDINNIEQFKADNFIQFEGLLFDNTNKRVKALQSSGYNFYLSNLSGNNSTAIPNEESNPYATLTEIFNIIETLGIDNSTIFFIQPGNYSSDVKIPNRNINFIGDVSGNTNILFNSNLISNTSVCEVTTNVNNERKNTILNLTNLTLNLSNGQALRNINSILLGENLSITSTSAISSFSSNLSLVRFNFIGCTFNTITLNSGSVTNAGVIGCLNAFNNKIFIKKIICNTNNQYLTRELNNLGNNLLIIDIREILGSGNIFLNMISSAKFNLRKITGNVSVTLSDQSNNDAIYNFDNAVITTSGVVSFGDGYGTITGIIMDSSTKGITIGFGRGGAISIFKNFKGKIENSDKYTTSYGIVFIDSHIELDTYLFRLQVAQPNDSIKFIGTNTFLQATAGDLINSNSQTLQIEKRGQIFTNATSLGTNVTLNNLTPNTY